MLTEKTVYCRLKSI